MDPVDPSGGQNPGSSASGGTDPFVEELQALATKGQNFFMELLFGDSAEAGDLLDAATGRRYGEAWRITQPLKEYAEHSWVEHDLSDTSGMSDYMERFKTLFGSMTVGHNQLNVMTTGTPAIRHPSRKLWPNGPNRFLRLVNDKPFTWRKTRGFTGGIPPTHAYYDVIYNIKDGLMILLRQLHPADAIRQRSPAARPSLAPAPHFIDVDLQRDSNLPYVEYGYGHMPAQLDASRLWAAEWAWQRAPKNPQTVKKYAQMEPQHQAKWYAGSITFMQGLHTIIVPDVGVRYESTRTQRNQLSIIETCLKLADADLQNVPQYNRFGSFFPAGTYCINALLATPPNSDIVMLLARNKKGNFHLGHKTITGVSIIKLDGSSGQTGTRKTTNSVTLLWHIADFKAQDKECAEKWRAFKFGEPLPLIPGGSDPSQYGEGSAKGKGKAKQTAAASPIPEKCYPEIMKKWQTQQTAGASTDDPMDIDDDNQPSAGGSGTGTGGVGGSGQSSGQSGTHQAGRDPNDPLRLAGVDVLPGSQSRTGGQSQGGQGSGSAGGSRSG
ncbi:hypothetical protein Q7P37_002765 [Cladosporium fusiforme]